MSTRRAKQIIYGALYLVILVLICAAVYGVFRLVVPGVPVVAPCTSDCMPVGADSIATSTLQTFVTSPGHYTFLEQIVNTNADYAAEYFDYSIDFYDASGTVIQSIPGSSFIYGDQTKYLVVPNQTVADPGVAVGFSISDVYWVASSTLGVSPQFNIQNLQTGMTSTTVSVSGQITNSTIAAFQYVFVDVVFKGADGGPVGATQTELNNVGPGQTVDFSASYPANAAINPANSEPFVYGIKG
jgi:hypothetical protein